MHLKVSLCSDAVLDFIPKWPTSQTLKHHDGLELKTTCASTILILVSENEHITNILYIYVTINYCFAGANTFIPLSCH